MSNLNHITITQKDQKAGATHFKLRDYDARLARWTTIDPYNQYHSPYLAMGNNPISKIDPDGGMATGGGYNSDAEMSLKQKIRELQLRSARMYEDGSGLHGGGAHGGFASGNGMGYPSGLHLPDEQTSGFLANAEASYDYMWATNTGMFSPKIITNTTISNYNSKDYLYAYFKGLSDSKSGLLFSIPPPDDPPGGGKSKKTEKQTRGFLYRLDNMMYGNSNGDPGTYHVNTKKDYIFGASVILGVFTAGLAIEFAPEIVSIYETFNYTYSIINVSEATNAVIRIQGVGGVIDGTIRYKYDISPDTPYIFPNSPVYENFSNGTQWFLQGINN
jgi:RHS repeat-associated protein